MRDWRRGLVLFATGVLLLAFATPLRTIWAQSGLGWWAPFVLWGVAVLALAVAGAGADEGGDKRA